MVAFYSNSMLSTADYFRVPQMNFQWC